MRLTSGPASYDRLYNLFVMLLCLGLGAYFFYDWKIGYPAKNRAEAEKALAAIIDVSKLPAQLPLKPTEPDFDKFRVSRSTSATEMRAAFGEPMTTKPGPAGATIEYYVSATGMATATVSNGKIALDGLQWAKWSKTQSEVEQQFWCGVIAVAVALLFLPRALRSWLLSATIDDGGMTYGGKRIAFDAMKRFADYSPKGWVDLYYQDGAQERRLRIDNQKIAKFDEIIDAICSAKGFTDPRPRETAQEAAQDGT